MWDGVIQKDEGLREGAAVPKAGRRHFLILVLHLQPEAGGWEGSCAGGSGQGSASAQA